jgi:NAD(P)-dependent dehydrogenase (short-subunit alcohol dehydrogenase family)
LVDDFIGDGDKSIVVVGSIGAESILDEQPVGYHVAKAGMQQMVRYYALPLGHLGIRVNSVAPSTVLKERSKEFYLAHPELTGLYDSINPLGRMGTSQDVIDAIAFLCSSRASFITGQDLVVDRGASLRAPESLARRVASIEGQESSQQL